MIKLKCNPAKLPIPKLPQTKTVHTIEEINIAPDTMVYFPVGCEADEFKCAAIPYTEEELQRIADMYRDGATPTRIAKTIGRNTGAVYSKIQKLKGEGRI